MVLRWLIVASLTRSLEHELSKPVASLFELDRSWLQNFLNLIGTPDRTKIHWHRGLSDRRAHYQSLLLRHKIGKLRSV